MKKLILLLVTLFVVCGCTNIKKESIDQIINNSLNAKRHHTNTVSVGYKFYKPMLMGIVESSDSNEVLRSNGNLYYLYIDLVSYFNKTNREYEENDISYYSKKITHGKKNGYIEINELKDNQYLIEIMYNYAKIEVMVEERDIKEAVAYSMSVLSSIKYNDIVIQNKMGKDVLNTLEESVDIFKTKGKENTSLKYVEDNKYDKDVLPDMDLVN